MTTTVPERVAGPAPRVELLPVLPALAPLLPHGGLRRGSTVIVGGSTSLLLAVLAGASLAGSWCAVLGMPALGAAAAAEAGVSLGRLALVPAPGRDWPAVTAALLDALDLVVVAPRVRVRAADARRLAARARQRGAVLVPFGVPSGGWEGADLRLSVDRCEWTGLGDGWGHLAARRALVRSEGRGPAGRPRQARIWLPGTEGIAPLPPEPQVAPVVPIARQPRPAQHGPAQHAADQGGAGQGGAAQHAARQHGAGPGQHVGGQHGADQGGAGRIGPGRAGADLVGTVRSGHATPPVTAVGV